MCACMYASACYPMLTHIKPSRTEGKKNCVSGGGKDTPLAREKKNSVSGAVPSDGGFFWKKKFSEKKNSAARCRPMVVSFPISINMSMSMSTRTGNSYTGNGH